MAALTSPDIAEYLNESTAGVPADEFFGLMRFVRILDVHIAQLFRSDSRAYVCDCFFFVVYSINGERGKIRGKALKLVATRKHELSQMMPLAGLTLATAR